MSAQLVLSKLCNLNPDANGNPITTQTTQTTTMTGTPGQGQAFNSFAFPSGFNTMQPGMTFMNGGMMPNPGMVTTTSQVFDATSGMPIGAPSSVVTTATGQIVNGNTGLPMTTGAMTMNPATGMQMNTMGATNGFQGTGVGFGQVQPMNNQFSGQFQPMTNQNSMFTGMSTAGRTA